MTKEQFKRFATNIAEDGLEFNVCSGFAWVPEGGKLIAFPLADVAEHDPALAKMILRAVEHVAHVQAYLRSRTS